MANGIVVTGGTNPWALGVNREIIPANTITTMYDIHYVVFEEASVADTYEFVLYSGLSGEEVEVGRVRTVKDSNQSGPVRVPIQIPAQLANKRLSAKVASKSGGGDTVTISLMYHSYD